MHLGLVSHQIRERLDEIKRQEMGRLRQLAREKMKQMNGTQVLGSIAKYGGMKVKPFVSKITLWALCNQLLAELSSLCLLTY